MDEKLIEAMARALARHDNPKHENWWPSYESRAQAALTAHTEWLRDNGYAVVPVEALKKIAAREGRGSDHVTCYDCSDSSNEAQAMIAAAQGEE